jgi:hypothetical protein
MKSRHFMEGTSSAALMRGEIADNEVGAHGALSGLSSEFRNSAKWYGPRAPADSEGMVMRMLRLPNEEPNPTRNTSLSFVDSRRHTGPAEEISTDSLGQFWTACLKYIRPMPIEWYKAGPVIWKHLQFSVGSEWTNVMLRLKRSDDAMERAHQAALMSAWATNFGTIDLEAVHVALATFIHAHPAFAKQIEKAKWHLPYGDDTAYRLLKL